MLNDIASVSNHEWAKRRSKKERLYTIASALSNSDLRFNHNIEGGRTSILSLEELREMGFISVGYVLSGLFASAKALADTCAYLLEHGDTTGIRGKMMTFDEFNEIIGLEEKHMLDEQLG